MSDNELKAVKDVAELYDVTVQEALQYYMDEIQVYLRLMRVFGEYDE